MLPRSHAIRQAVFAIAAGMYDIVIAGGAEINNAKVGSKAPGLPRRMTNDERLRAIYCHYDQAWDLPQLSLQDMNLSQWMLAYCREYGLSIETLYDVLDATDRVKLPERSIRIQGPTGIVP